MQPQLVTSVLLLVICHHTISESTDAPKRIIEISVNPSHKSPAANASKTANVTTPPARRSEDRPCLKQTPTWIRQMRVKAGRDPCLLDKKHQKTAESKPTKNTRTLVYPARQSNSRGVRRQENVAWNWKNWKNNLLPGIGGKSSAGTGSAAGAAGFGAAGAGSSASGWTPYPGVGVVGYTPSPYAHLAGMAPPGDSSHRSSSNSQGGGSGFPIPPFYNLGASKPGRAQVATGLPVSDTASWSSGGIPRSAGGAAGGFGAGAGDFGGSGPAPGSGFGQAGAGSFGGASSGFRGGFPASGGAGTFPGQGAASQGGGSDETATERPVNEAWLAVYPNGNSIKTMDSWADKNLGADLANRPLPANLPAGFSTNPETPSISALGGPASWPTHEKYKGITATAHGEKGVGVPLSQVNNVNSRDPASPFGPGWQPVGNPFTVSGQSGQGQVPGASSGGFGPAAGGAGRFGSAGTSGFGPTPAAFGSPLSGAGFGSPSAGGFDLSQGAGSFPGGGSSSGFGSVDVKPSPSAIGGPASWPNYSGGGSAGSPQSAIPTWSAGGAQTGAGTSSAGGAGSAPLPGSSWFRGGGTPVNPSFGSSGSGGSPFSGGNAGAGSSPFSGQTPWYQGSGSAGPSSGASPFAGGQFGRGPQFGRPSGGSAAGSPQFGGSGQGAFGSSVATPQASGRSWNAQGAPSWLGDPIRRYKMVRSKPENDDAQSDTKPQETSTE